MRLTRPHSNRASAGFSLLELLLVVGLVLMLASALVFNFSALMRSSQLEEGTTRLETLMRFARAQAANSGRKVQLVFNSESTNAPATTNVDIRATWEPDPLGQPGCFTDLADAQWHVQEINDLVQVESVKLLDGTSTSPVPTACPEEPLTDGTNSVAAAKPVAPITFYPDGSSDSAEIIVAARDPEEEQRMSVRLMGMTGSISHQLVSVDLEEGLFEPGAMDRNGQTQIRRENLMRDSATDRDKTPRPLSSPLNGSSSRPAKSPLQHAPRIPVGETNSVDRAE